MIPHDMESALADGESTRTAAMLAPGRYHVRVLIGGSVVAEDDFDVVDGAETAGSTRLDVR